MLNPLNNSFQASIDNLSPNWSTQEIIMTNPSNGTTYTCTEDCWIMLHVNNTGKSIGVSLTVNERVASAIDCRDLNIIFPPFRCKKNDVVKFNSWGATPNEVYIYKSN